MDLNLKGKTVIVAGGASNIGRGITLAFAEEGANVVIADLDEVQAKRVAEEVNKLAGKAIAVKTDVTDQKSVQAMVDKTLAEFKVIDVLVNDVGWDRLIPFMDMTLEDMEKVINVNYWSVLHGCRTVLPHMMERKYGKIVSIGSDAGRVGERGEAVYSGIKAGVIAFSKALAREVARDGININVVCPSVTLPADPDQELGADSLWAPAGPVYWEMMDKERQAKMIKRSYPLGRLGKPQDIANMVVFLASDAANWITGQTVSVNGGYCMM